MTRIWILAAVAAVCASPAQAHNGKVAVAFPMAPVVVDGDLSDWPDGLTEHTVTPRYQRTTLHPDDLHATLRLGFDVERAILYGAVQVTDESIVVRTGAPEDLAQMQWDQEDGLELYVGSRHDEHQNTAQLGLRGDRVIRMSGSESVRVAARRLDAGHAYEFAIDLTGFGLLAPLREDTVIPFDLAVVDRDADDSFTWASWGPHGTKTFDSIKVGDVLLSRTNPVSDAGLAALSVAVDVGTLETWQREGSSKAINAALFGLIAAAALLHVLLFAFHPTDRAPLYYAIFAGLLAATIVLGTYGAAIIAWLGMEPYRFVFMMSLLVTGASLAWLRFLYSLFSDRLPKRAWILLALAGVWLLWQILLLVVRPDFLTGSLSGSLFSLFTLTVILLPSIESMRVSITALRRRQAGARIVFVAYSPVLATLVVGVVVPDLLSTLTHAMYAAAWLVLVMAAHLALNVARTQRQLEEQLVQVRDLTARTLRQNRQIEETTRNKSQFLRRMSHDLRSPMNAIIGYTRLLRRRLADRVDEREARNLANIETSSTNLLNLINDILDLSRIEAGRIEVIRQPVDVRDLAQECADSLESIVKEDVVLRRELDDVGEISCDPDRLRQVLMNLLGNATKFTDAGTITLSVKQDGDNVELSVADTGIGIPPEDLPHIFDEFRQVERQGGEQSEGTGLGLAIAKKTVELLGGEIRATSEAGAGTTFTVRLRSA